ncbi:MBL fold metallo-hydrolase [Clostridium algidicarnis]|uniref:MBL fold metallo-hydrolase n=1 Tax=Clostridium algidicarnis TaxID=37659 RepID=UPI0016257762|nr:MBL fold metallo-hydrolase [Clostridium algidicarnis]MBB6697217.1 MBL fold metallo-hydrolase [Clostridium algidicarnis]MBU3192364.1 MBL fold metallo-hydrolase [Clostridium algidicarnis]
MELKKINGNSYYIPSGTNIGVYTFKNKNCILIDTGINNTSARKVEEALIENNLHPKYIINTHSHLDHCGANNYFLNNYPGCITYASLKEKIFMENPEIMPYALFSSYAAKELKKSNTPINVDEILDYGINKINDEKMEIISLKGHSMEHIGIITPDKVCYLGDSIFSEEIIKRHPFPYLYNIEESLNTLEYIKTLDADYFMVSHAKIIYSKDEIINLADINIENIHKYINQCLELLDQPLTREDLLESIALLNDIDLGFNEYYINLGATSAFIAYLYNKSLIHHSAEDGKLYYFKK